jgi:putative heme-binding domain-containing protein
MPHSLLMILLVWCRSIANCRLVTAVGSNGEPAIANRESAPVVGRRDFESRCSPCHGLDGRGGERGPNISTNSSEQQLSDEEVFRIVRDGIPSRGMPSFGFLAPSEIRSIVSYLRSLGRRSPQRPWRGDPARGQELFFGKAECGSCHMIRGKGGFLGSDLTGYGQSHGPDEVREGILNPGRFHDLRHAVLEVVTRRGERFSGVVRNEDNFSLQLLGADGAFYMLMKSEVEHSSWRSSPAMPEDYGKRLTSSELDDLVSYVAQSPRRPSPAPSHTPTSHNPRN